MTSSNEEINPNLPYKFISDLESTWFSFVTKNGIHYEVVFYKSPALFHEYPLIGGCIYEMSINTSSDNPPFDNSNRLTIIDIVRQFFLNQNVLLFVCDSTDGKHHTRQEKFERWIDSASLGDDFEKHNGHIDLGDYELINTIILKTNFELKQNILEAFFEINNQ
jgi:Family of unknown function (DUF6169)